MTDRVDPDASDFDLDEWMWDNKLKQGSDEDWEGVGDVVLAIGIDHYDVRLKDGRETGPCCMVDRNHLVDLSSDEDSTIALSDVSHVRLYKTNDGSDEDEDDDDDDEGDAWTHY
jgi:hypothetical protein